MHSLLPARPAQALVECSRRTSFPLCTPPLPSVLRKQSLGAWQAHVSWLENSLLPFLHHPDNDRSQATVWWHHRWGRADALRMANEPIHGKAIQHLYHILLQKHFSETEMRVRCWEGRRVKLAVGAPQPDDTPTHLPSGPGGPGCCLWEACQFLSPFSISLGTDRAGLCMVTRKPQARDPVSLLCHHIKAALSKNQTFPRACLSSPHCFPLHMRFLLPWITCQLLTEFKAATPRWRISEVNAEVTRSLGSGQTTVQFRNSLYGHPVPASTPNRGHHRPCPSMYGLQPGWWPYSGISQRPVF